MNPMGSVKDRIGRGMIEHAESQGLLKPGMTIYEATAGNTGQAILGLSNAKGYKCIFYCPEKVSAEKIANLQTLGAEVVLCPNVGADDPQHFRLRCLRECAERGGYSINQFANPANYQAHYQSTGPEIYRQTEGKIDAFICNSGTGGTIGGVSKYLKEQRGSIETYFINTNYSGVTVDKTTKKFRVKEDSEKSAVTNSILEGIGGGIDITSKSTVECGLQNASMDGEVFVDGDQLPIRMLHYVNRHDGLCFGGSTGVNLVGAYKLAKQYGPTGKIIITVAGDHGSKYASKLYNEVYLANIGITIGDVTNLDFVA